MEHCLTLRFGIGQPHCANRSLTVIFSVVLLVDAQSVREPSHIVNKLVAEAATDPFEAIGKNWQKSIVDRGTLMGPAVVPHSQLTGRESLFSTTKKEISIKLGKIKHKARLTKTPF